MTFFSLFSGFATSYYNVAGATDAGLTASWTDNVTGIGGTLLSAGTNNFTSGDVFIIRSGSSITASTFWSVAGTGCGIVVDGTLSLGSNISLGSGGGLIISNTGSFLMNTFSLTFPSNAVNAGSVANNGGVFNGGSGTIIVQAVSPATWTTSGSSTISINNLTFSGSAVFNNQNPAAIIKGILTCGSGLTAPTGGSNVGVLWSSSSTLSGGPFSVGTLWLPGAPGIIGVTPGYPNNVTVSGALTMATGIYSLAGNLIISSGTPFPINATSLYVGGNWIKNGGTFSNVQNVYFTGTSTQTISGASSTAFNKLFIANTAQSVVLAQDISVSSTFSILNGTFDAGATNKVSGAAAATVSALTNVTTNLTTTLGSLTATVVNSTGLLGMTVPTSSGVPANTIVASLVNATTITLSQLPTSGVTTLPTTFSNIGTLKTANAAGIVPVATGLFGSIQTNTRNYNAGNYEFNGISNQTTFLPAAIRNLKINNTTSGGIVTVNTGSVPVIAGTLSLSNGILDVATNSITTLNVTNNSNNPVTGGIIGGSATSFINGVVTWSLPAGFSSGTYTFPVGAGVVYLPFAFNPQTAGAISAKVQAFNTGTGGGGASLTLSSTEYWSLVTSGVMNAGAVIATLGRYPTSIPAGTLIVENNTGAVNAAAAYSSIGGTSSGTNLITGSATSIGTALTSFFTLGILATPPVVNSALTASGTETISFTYNITGTNSPTSYAIASGTLPSGLSVNNLTGAITGTPVIGSAGTYNLTVTASNAAGPSVAQALTITIAALQPPVITSGGAASGIVASAFNYAITATNSPTSYSVTGSLPPGITINTSTGIISGTPTIGSSGVYNVNISAANAAGTGAAQALAITITSPPPPVITSLNSASGLIGSAFSYNITATNTPTSFSVTGSLPSGITVNAATGLISGTPNLGSVGSYPVTINASNPYGTGSQSLTITITSPPPPVITSSATATGTVGSAFTYSITATNSPTSYTVTGSLPVGLTLNGVTGAITGTPGAGTAGVYPVTINAINPYGTGSQSLTITISNVVLYYRSNASGNWNSTGTWLTSTTLAGTYTAATTTPDATSQFIRILTGHTVTITASTGNIGNGVTIDNGGTLIVNSGLVLTISANTLLVNGTLNIQTGASISGAGNFTLPDVSCGSITSTLKIGDTDGITSAGLAGSIRVAGTRFFGKAYYEYNCSTVGTAQFTGNALPVLIKGLIINRSTAADIVSLTNSLTIEGGSCGGYLTLNTGIFKVNIANAITFDNNSSSNNIINNPNAPGTSNIATSGANGGEDGGKIVAKDGSGADFIINGPGLTTFYNISVGISAGNGNRKIVMTSANTVRINGTFSVFSDQCKWTGFSPAWGPAATLSINNGGQQYIPGSANKLEWIAIAPGSGTIGTTPGYPNNVTISNSGTSASNYNGNQYGVSLSGSWSINGTLQAGTSTTTGFIDLNNGGTGTNNFSCGGISIENSSKLAAPNGNFFVKGNWLRTGATIGVFVHNNSVTNFSGSGTVLLPQTINLSTGIETSFYNVTVSNGTYVKLNKPVTLGTINLLTLSLGIIETNASNILSITNTALTGISGTGTSTNFINGPVKWSIALAGKYVFPLGKGTTYLPLELTPGFAAPNTITAEAFNTNSSGVPDGTTVTSISNTEYWSLSASVSFSAGANVSTGRNSGIGAFNMLAKSTIPNGIYSAIGGSAGTVGGTTGIVNGAVTGTPAPLYIVMAYGPLNINVTSITYPSCTGSTGSVTVAGSGGVPPYTYKIGAGSYQPSGLFIGLAAGSYTFTVKDNVNNTQSIVVEVDALVLTPDTSTCNGGSIQLLASSGTAWSYSWSPATGLSSTTIANPVATPASTTTYTASAIIIDNTSNLITNPGFESGNTGFSGGFIYHICAPYASSWSPTPPAPCDTYGQFHNGIYLITGNTQNLCTNLTNFGPRTGSNMLVVDGPNSVTYTTAPYYIWRSQTLTGLTTNTNYVFTYWVKRAFNGAGADAVLRTKINSVNATGTPSYPNPFTASPTSWTQVSYLWYSGASTTATIEMFDETVADAANDFALDDLSFYITCEPSKTVTVTITTPPTLGTVTQPVQICGGQGAVINLSGLPVSSSFTVNYTINGIAQTPVLAVVSNIAGNASFTTSILTAANNGQVLEITSLIPGNNPGCTQLLTSKTVTLTVSTLVIWLGSTNTDWNTASNWCGGVPTAISNVLIPDYGVGAIYPLIAAGTAGLCNNISISTNASVIISHNPGNTVNGILSVNGTFTNSGTFTNYGELIFSSSLTAQSFPGPAGTITAMKDITVNNTSGLGVTFNRSFSVYGALTPTAGVINVNNAFITLASTDSATARVGVVGSSFTYTGTGKFIVERYYPARRSWRLVTAPLYSTGTIFNEWQLGGAAYGAGNIGKGTLITGPGATFPIGANGLDISQEQNPSLKTGVNLTPVLNTKTPTLSKNLGPSADNIGYFLFVRGDRDPSNTLIPNKNNTTISSSGKLQTGVQTFTANTTGGGLTLIGNPYASPVEFRNTTRTNLINRFYAWDPKLAGSTGQGAYVTVDDALNTGVYTLSGPTPGGQTSVIQSGQAIFVETVPAGGTALLVFNENNKALQNNLGIFRPSPRSVIPESFRTVLYLLNPADHGTEAADGNLVQFDNQCSDAVDEMDAIKFFNINETFALSRKGVSLSIERRPVINMIDTLFFKISRFRQRNYRLEFTPEKLNHHNLAGFFEDNFLHSSTALNMNSNTIVDFSVTSNPLSSAPDRFKIVFRQSVNYLNVKALQFRRQTLVEWKVAAEFNIHHYDIEKSFDGELFDVAGSKTATGNNYATIAYTWIDRELPRRDCYYRIKGISNNGVIAYSNKVKVSADEVSPIQDIRVFPNPIDGHTIRLQTATMPAGVYTATLLNSMGQVEQTSKIIHTEGNETEVIKIDKTITKGIYELQIVGGNNFITKLKVLN